MLAQIVACSDDAYTMLSGNVNCTLYSSTTMTGLDDIAPFRRNYAVDTSALV